MKANVELKAHCSDPDGVRSRCGSMGAVNVRSGQQEDTYYRVEEGKLKYRRDETQGDCLIHYVRSASPSLRCSQYTIEPAAETSGPLHAMMNRAAGVLAVVRKHRESFAKDNVTVNLDHLENLGDFVEIEVRLASGADEDTATLQGERLRDQLGISRVDMVPWSYADLVLMQESSSRWHQQVESTGSAGTLYLLDGASCSGKTSLAHQLADDKDLNLTLAPRYCTRERRPDETTESEYIFVSHREFEALTHDGAFIEYRDYEFGMSYGLPWKQCLTPLLSGDDALGVINLATVRHVKRLLPDAVTILVNAPLETIRSRLIKRGFNDEQQIEERLGNARTVGHYRDHYDLVVDNDDGMLDEAIAHIKGVILARR